MKSVLCILTSLLFIASVHVTNAATVPTGFTDSVVIAGLTDPTAMALAPDGRIFRWYHGSDWKPDDLLREVKEALQNRS